MVAMDVLSASEMQSCDRLTAERFGVSSTQLMRQAAEAVAAFVRSEFPQAWRVTVLCGQGNNGGDGLMVARLLLASGLEVTTLLLGSPAGLSGDALLAWDELAAQEVGGGAVHIVLSGEEFKRYDAALRTDLLIDAVVGTGFKPPLRRLPLAALEWARQSDAPVLAVDLPSGWGADEKGAAAVGPVFRADAVMTFTAPKAAHVFGHLTRCWLQPVVVAAIGSPEEAITTAHEAGGPGLTWAGTALELAQRPRPTIANKGSFGHVLVVGGTFGSAGGKVGAPAMAALAALRSGAGLVTAAVPEAAMGVVAAVTPELMTWPLRANVAGQIDAPDANGLAELVANKTVLAIGPGMGQAAVTAEFLGALLRASTVPVVIDADGLNLLAATPDLMAEVKAMALAGRTVVLTPHPGEMARLAGISVAEVQADRLGTVRGLAGRLAATVVLKGARTLIAHPDGRVAVNTTGNPGMAKGGSGDLLAGLIAGLMAQFPNEREKAVVAAVYLHGLAADLAVRRLDEHTLLATDCLDDLARAFQSQAFHFHSKGQSGYVWLQGLPNQTRVAGE
jgi:NAD(P)H-hydrate epimerase